ncbi:hypothetical protein GX51_07860 [Blastomyces parvus]|uniref:Cytochrome P450 oxidoreductase n=1 Tax=Blastomyces parvus TaxID=2060905 RepID=A0A2B7WHZ5_9EURO|nr:hypothetical protein GX51_07860 [Blastomyces parvus]
MLSSNLSLIQIVAAGFSVYWVGWVVYCRYFHPLRSIPGPPFASISRLWLVYKTATGDVEHTQRALHKKHGYLVRIAPNELACSDPSAIKTIYGTKSQFTKTDYYDSWAPPNNGYVGHFPARDEKQHSERRRIVNNVYSMSSVLESEKAIDSCTELLCEAMRDFSKQESAVDLALWMNMYAFDVLGELFYGRMFGMMRERTDIGNYMKSIQSLLPAFTIGGTLPSYLSKLYLISTILFSPSVRGALGAVKHIAAASVAAVERRVEELKESRDDKHDMIRKMLEISADRGEKINFKHSDIVGESHSSLFAGADTTSIALTSVLYYLMRHPAVYAKLTAEIDTAMADGTISIPITYKDATKLPYLKACVTESMRLHPGVGLTLPRLVPAGGTTISGFHIPGGYRVGINGAVVHYDQDVFGPDADEYNPDRWINGDAMLMDKAMIPFGSGQRTCLGKNISLSEIYKMIPRLLRDFHFRLADPQKEWKTHNYWFNKQSDVFVYVKERTHV